MSDAIPPTELHDDVSPRDLRRLADQVNDLSNNLGFARRCTIGGVIHDEVFQGSRLAWRAGASRAHAHFRELATLLRGRISKSELHRCVQTYLLVQDLPFVRESSHLTVSHVDAVAALHRADQQTLLRRAEDARWTVKELARQKSNLLSSIAGEGRPPGRPRHDDVQVAASRCKRALVHLEEAEKLVFSRTEMDVAHLNALEASLEGAERTLFRLRRRIEAAYSRQPSSRHRASMSANGFVSPGA